LEYHEEVHEAVVIVQAQNQRINDASRALHARLRGILDEVAERRADEEFKNYQYPEPSEVDFPESPELEESPYSPVAEPDYNDRPLGLQAPPELEDVPSGPGPAVVGSHPALAQEQFPAAMTCSYCRVKGHQFSHACVREVVERLREQNTQVFAPRVRDDSVFLRAARHEQVEYFQDSDVRDGPVAPLPAPKRKRK
jgi:hypothetical protein